MRLTARGGEQLRQLGQRLRERYGALGVQVYASNFRRTQQSAQFFLSGFKEKLDVPVPILVRAKQVTCPEDEALKGLKGP